MMDRLNLKQIVVVLLLQIRYPCYGIDMAKLEGFSPRAALAY
jgi:hypothetical protein